MTMPSETQKADAIQLADAYLATCNITWDATAGGYVTDGDVHVSQAWEQIPREEHACQAITHTLSWCGCGDGDAALGFLRDVLRILSMKGPSGYHEFSAWYRDVQRPMMDRLMPSHGSRYFVWYCLDAMKLTEHGSSVPGWLSDKGKLLLAALEALPL